MKRIVLLLFFIMQWSVQAQMVGTPRMPFVNSSDKIRAALSTSVTAYDNAASNTLVEITLIEYNTILSTVTGAAKKGIDNISTGGLGTVNDMVGTGPNFSVLTANSYIAAVAFTTYTPSTGAIAVTCAGSLTASSTCLTGSSPSLSWAAATPKYFAVKKPTTNCGTNTFLGRLSTSGSVLSAGVATGSSYYNQTLSASCGTAMAYSIAWSPSLQVIATTTKSW